MLRPLNPAMSGPSSSPATACGVKMTGTCPVGAGAVRSAHRSWRVSPAITPSVSGAGRQVLARLCTKSMSVSRTSVPSTPRPTLLDASSAASPLLLSSRVVDTPCDTRPSQTTSGKSACIFSMSAPPISTRDADCRAAVPSSYVGTCAYSAASGNAMCARAPKGSISTARATSPSLSSMSVVEEKPMRPSLMMRSAIPLDSRVSTLFKRLAS